MAFDPLSSQGMITALKMGARLGLELSRAMESGTSDGEAKAMRSITEVYEKVREDYDSKKLYYYGQVRRFESDFWRRRHGEE